MPDFFLTPAFLVMPACRPLAQESPGIALMFRREELWLAGMDQQGCVYENPVAAHDWDDHLSLFRLPGRVAPAPSPVPASRWFETLWHAEKACVCATRGDWEGVGINADRCQEVGRAAGEPDSFADFLYADARLAGGWGGLLCGGELSLWSPPGCVKELNEIVKKAGGERVATWHAA